MDKRLIWAKTDAGRAEMKARSLVNERAQRNLLLVIDGKMTAEKLLANLAGITPADFEHLAELGLIEAVNAAALVEPLKPAAAQAAAATPGLSARGIDVEGFDFATLRGAIGRMISQELGIRGFALSMVLEESTTVDDLKEVAQRLLKTVAERKGIARADEVSRALFG